jgi:hypothetical protein
MPVGKGKERAQLNLPEGTAEAMDRVMRRIRAEAEATGEEAPFGDRGEFVGWLVARVEAVAEAEEKAMALLEEAEAEREEARRVRADAESWVSAARQDIARAEQEIAEADAELRRQTGLAKWALGLLADLGAEGMSRDDVLAVAKAMRASGLEPGEVARAMEREDVQGLVGWANRLRQACETMAGEYQKRAEENAALKRANAELRRGVEEATKALEEAEAEARAAKAYAERVRRTAEELGIYLQAIGSQGMRVEDMPEEMARVLAGVILLAAVDTHGDAQLLVPANVAMRRMLPMEVLLSELPYVLAPREAYARMREAQARRAARAERLANGMSAETDTTSAVNGSPLA